MIKWEKTIIDRDSWDLAYARVYLNQARQGLNDNTEHLRACLNFSDLNRIEGNLFYLNEELRPFNLALDVEQFRTNWGMLDLFTVIDVRRIESNITHIANQLGFNIIDDLHPIQPSNLHFEYINTIEAIILMLGNFVSSLTITTQILDKFKSDAPRKLPIQQTIKEAQALRKEGVLNE